MIPRRRTPAESHAFVDGWQMGASFAATWLYTRIDDPQRRRPLADELEAMQDLARSMRATLEANPHPEDRGPGDATIPTTT